MKCNYYKNIRNSRVLIAAPLPKPFGGIAVHAYRLKNELEHQQNVVCVYQAHLHTNKLKRTIALIDLILKNRPKILISHTSYHGLLEALLFIVLRLVWFEQWILVDHDCRYLRAKSFFFKRIHVYACARANCVVLMGKEVHNLYEKQGIKLQHSCIDSPYIPFKKGDVWLNLIPSEVDAFIAKHKKTILINGSYFMKDDKNRDVYGFDTAIQLLKYLRASEMDTGLIIMIGKNNDESYFSYLNREIVRNNLTDHVLWLIGDYYLPSIISRVSCMIRPTISENFGMSVAEAIDFGIPVVASNCCYRYPGTKVYQAEDRNALHKLVLFVLQRTE